jgi:hypothetical protein
MSNDPRIVVEGVQRVGVNEGPTFTLDITNVGSSPTGLSTTVEDADGNDLTSTVMPSGSPSSPTATTILLPPIPRSTLSASLEYRIITLFTVGGQLLAGIIPIEAVA